VTDRYLVLEVPDDALITAIAEERSMIDADLDDLERRILSPSIDPQLASAIALTVARAGRGSSIETLRIVHARLLQQQRAIEASALLLARELCNVRPPPSVERAERGYRRTDVALGETLYVEDPLATHWHRQGRWGPPLRPDPDGVQHFLRGGEAIDEIASAIDDGAVAIVAFRAGRVLGRPHAALRLMRAGLARDVGLTTLVRWSNVSSVGMVERWRTRRVAFETGGGPLEILPSDPSLPADDLLALMTRLLKRARPC
jgi:hypothetical protein